MIRWLCSIFLIAAMSSCGTIAKIDKQVDKLKDINAKLDIGTDSLKVFLGKIEGGAQVIAKADRNKDGRITGIAEWGVLILGLLQALGIYRNSKSDARKARIETATELATRDAAEARKAIDTLMNKMPA